MQHEKYTQYERMGKMTVYAILNNSKESKFIECVAAESFEDVLKYSEHKYGNESMLVGLPIIYDTKGNLVHIQVSDVIKEEYKIK